MKTNCIILFALITSVFGSCAIDDSPGRISLTIDAIENDNNSKLTGGIYRIINNDDVIGDYSADDGAITIITLPTGNYVVEEVAPPYGYVSDHKQITFSMDEGTSRQVTFTYKKETGSKFLPDKMDVTFYDKYFKRETRDYTAIRIGEYYWINSNFIHGIPAGFEFENPHPVTQELLNRYLDRARLDKSQYQLADVNDFEKYYGRYYSRPSLEYMKAHGEVHEKTTKVKLPGWGFPTSNDVRQLFAMCPFNTSWDAPHTALNERDVRFALAAREGDNPMAFEINDPAGGGYKTYFFSRRLMTNMYGFNLMPGGARLNGAANICNGYGPNGGCYPDGVLGDLYGLFYVAGFAAINDNGAFTGAGINDYIDIRNVESYHMFNVRWCKPLSANELGYRLYINAEQTDIKKLGLNDAVPTGYNELPHGYLRGFYVHYILDKPNPTVTVADIVQYAKNVQEMNPSQP